MKRSILAMGIVLIIVLSFSSMLISCNKVNTVENIQEYEGTPITRIEYISSIFHTNPSSIYYSNNISYGYCSTKSIRIIDFENNNITSKAYLSGVPKEKSVKEDRVDFADEDEKYIIDRLYTYGLLDLEDNYSSTEAFDGAACFSLKIYFEDGNIKVSSGIAYVPYDVLKKCAIAIYDKTHYQFWTVPIDYIEPPQIKIEQISYFNDGFNSGGSGDNCAKMYKYKWHTTNLDNGDLYEFASKVSKSSYGFVYTGKGARNYLLLRTSDYFSKNDTKYVEKFTRCVVKEYDNTPELTNEKVLLDTGWIQAKKPKEVDVLKNKIYTIELTFSNDWYSIEVVVT